MNLKRKIEPSEMILNSDGSIFHLHLHPDQLADTVILVGDPGRVPMVASYFESREYDIQNRELRTITGNCNGRRVSVVSTGMGTDNIDIVVTELDALANVDFETRTVKDNLKQLTLVRLGTTGGLQPDIEIGTPIFARTSVGFDGVLGFYKGRDSICHLDMERAFVEHTGWSNLLPRPYFVDSDPALFELFADVALDGITIAAPGFYGPQGRWVRLEPADTELNAKIESFRYQGRRITNYEMESSALAGLSRLMGHHAATVCCVIAQRVAKNATTDYKPFVNRMIETALERLTR